MQCFRCNKRKTDLGQMFCGGCQQEQRQQEEEARTQEQARQERWKKSTYTYLYFCQTCGSEVHRCSHVPHRRNSRREQKMEQMARLALFKHARQARHTRTRLHGPICINELGGDDEFEVPTIGLPEDRCPREQQASSVMRELRKAGLI